MTPVEKIALLARFKVWAPLRINRFSSFYSSHAQFGEDMVARALLADVKSGVYVDIGAHHPVFYSNTYHFYRRGWRGVNIDALPGSMEAFRLLRRRDINIEACLADRAGKAVQFYRFEQPALSTTDPELARQRQHAGARLIDTVAMTTTTLGQCLRPHLSGRRIDLLSIDIEGADEQILLADDWREYSPRLIIFERHDLDLARASDEPLISRLMGLGYSIVGKCGPSLLMGVSGAPARTS